MSYADRCVCCGEIVPEGRMVCWACEHPAGKGIKVNKAEKAIDWALEIARDTAWEAAGVPVKNHGATYTEV